MDNEATRIGGAGGSQLAVGAVLAHTYEIVRFIRAGVRVGEGHHGCSPLRVRAPSWASSRIAWCWRT